MGRGPGRGVCLIISIIIMSIIVVVWMTYIIDILPIR
jgi:hypothetical protein